MGTQPVAKLRDVSQGRPPSRLRLLAPLRYLAIRHPEKTIYDFYVPAISAIIGWVLYWAIEPHLPLFGESGLLRFARDLLIMAVPFMIGALAAVAMGSPGAHMDSRPRGLGLSLDGKPLTLRQFTCYLLGYLSFLGLLTLAAVVAAGLLHNDVVRWTAAESSMILAVRVAGTFILSCLLAGLTVTVLWALYFLTDIVNRTE